MPRCTLSPKHQKPRLLRSSSMCECRHKRSSQGLFCYNGRTAHHTCHACYRCTACKVFCALCWALAKRHAHEASSAITAWHLFRSTVRRRRRGEINHARRFFSARLLQVDYPPAPMYFKGHWSNGKTWPGRVASPSQQHLEQPTSCH